MRRGNVLAGVAVAIALLLWAGGGWTASAAQPSTPNVTVTLNNPAATGALLAVTAHSDAEGADHGSLVYQNGGVILNGLELHRLWVPGLGDHEQEAAMAEDSGQGCGDSEPGVIKIRGLSMQRGVGQVQVWVDVRPGDEDSSMVRVRVRPKTDCGGHEEPGLTAAAAADDGGHGDDHGAWTHNSGWIPLHVLNVAPRG